MAGKKHQFIMGLVVKLMRNQGICIMGVDGHYPGLLGDEIAMPPQVLRHRPDVIGIRPDGQVCIGEAKTEGDLANLRTYAQIEDFCSIELNGHVCQVFLGIPTSAKARYLKMAKERGLKKYPNIIVFYVPDELIN